MGKYCSWNETDSVVLLDWLPKAKTPGDMKVAIEVIPDNLMNSRREKPFLFDLFCFIFSVLRLI
jgi:hypothetical protein